MAEIMTSTERLRKLLDERGVEHIDNDDERDETTEPLTTTWEYTQCGYEMVVTAIEVRDTENKPYLDMDFHHYFTPEQAIAATLGSMVSPKVAAELRGYADRAMREGGMYFSGDCLDSLAKRAESESAIVATLGSGTLTAEQARELIAPHLHARPTFDFGRHGAVWVADFQAIADELNATLGNWTCEYAIKDNMNESEGMGDVWIECSACHCAFDYYADDWLMNMHYCPNCGARVERRAQ